MTVRAPSLTRILLVMAAATALSAARAPVLPTAPLPPCAGEAQPAFAQVGEPPNVRAWHLEWLPAEWRPAPCSRIERREGAVLVAVAGRFQSPLDGHELLARLGAVSDHATMLYWSVSRSEWRPLFEDSSALESADPQDRRDDFKPDEIEPGATLFLLHDDIDAVGPVVNEVTIDAASADGFVVATRNLTSARLLGLQVAGPGDLASHLAIERESGDVYRYFALGSTALAMPLLPEASHINRAVALYRYIAGIPADQEPPAATE